MGNGLNSGEKERNQHSVEYGREHIPDASHTGTNSSVPHHYVWE